MPDEVLDKYYPKIVAKVVEITTDRFVATNEAIGRFELPLNLLPKNSKEGEDIKISFSKNTETEAEKKAVAKEVLEAILNPNGKK
ncbi:MAG: hypothetical protein ABIE68_03275 [bacterium]